MRSFPTSDSLSHRNYGNQPRRPRPSTSPGVQYPPPYADDGFRSPHTTPTNPLPDGRQQMPRHREEFLHRRPSYGNDYHSRYNVPTTRTNHGFSPPPGASAPRIPGQHPSHQSTQTRSAPPLPPYPVMHLHRSVTAPPPTPPPPPPPPPIPSKPFVPPLPPKVPLDREDIPDEDQVTSPHEVEGSAQIEEIEEDELARALAISASESGKHQDLINEEEEELARAIEESLRLSALENSFGTSIFPDASRQSDNADAGPSNQYLNQQAAPAVAIPAPLQTHAIDGQMARPFLPPTSSAQITDDEVLARRLAQEEIVTIVPEQTMDNGNGTRPEPPQYDDIVSSTLNSRLMDKSRSFMSLPSLDTQDPTHHHPTLLRSLSSTSSASHTSGLETRSLPGSLGTSVAPSSGSSGHMGIDEGNLQTPSVPIASSPRPSVAALPVLPTVGEGNEPESSETLTMVSPNQYIDSDFLQGFSLGFDAPVISTTLIPMTAPIPNIISLPYGKCPPLYVQAPNWRHLLMLMARLSGTRIEPNISALNTRSELKLRTVVQLIKIHHASNDWRTILWFTIDHPIPPTAPNASKHAQNDVNALPWSYSLSSVPTLLRDGMDTLMSKTYTIPSTESTPYPSLPINFPNLAMYLQAALEESRRAVETSNNANGIRKLCKMLDTCYPLEFGQITAPEKKTVGGLFKRVIGMGNKTSTKQRGINEDTYELVTPFVPDEWG